MEQNLDAKNIFVNSFIKIIGSKFTGKITATDVINESGLSRQTFYRYFIDLDDLVYYIHDQNTALSFNFIESMGGYGFKYKLYLDLMIKHQQFYKQILSSDLGDKFVETYFTKTKENFIKYLFEGFDKEILNDIDLLSSLDFYVYGVAFTIFEWIKGNTNYTSDYLSDILYNNIPSNLTSFTYAKNKKHL